MVHAVGADVLLDVGVLVVVDPEAGVAGCLRQVGDQTRFSNGSLALPKKAASGDFFVEFGFIFFKEIYYIICKIKYINMKCFMIFCS